VEVFQAAKSGIVKRIDIEIANIFFHNDCNLSIADTKVKSVLSLYRQHIMTFIAMPFSRF